MADQGSNQTRHRSSSGMGESTSTANVTDQALSAGRKMKDKAVDLAESSSGVMRDQASEFVDAAKDAASQATGKIQEAVGHQKAAGADYVGNIADTVRRAAREFDNDLPIAGVCIRKAASRIESVADSIRTGNFSDLVQGTQSFARRQPTVFLGMAVLAGFGVVRFLKSSAKHPSDGSAKMAGGQRVGSAGSQRSASANKGYRDEFAR